MQEEFGSSFGEDFIKEIEEGGDVEATFEKYLKKGLRLPGTSKQLVQAYLLATLKQAVRQGRLQMPDMGDTWIR